jgi:hypothetical protein
MRFMTYAAVTAVALGLGALSVAAPRAGQDAPAVPQIAATDTDVNPEAGFFANSGGFVRAKLSRTQTASSALAEGAWRPLSGATLTRVVAAGTTDLFNVTFSAECFVRSLGVGDAARIRIAHFINGVLVAPVEPYDGDQRFCSSTSQPATYTGNWSRRFGAGTHVIRVEINPTDFGADNGIIAAVIDDWTFELVVYD